MFKLSNLYSNHSKSIVIVSKTLKKYQFYKKYSENLPYCLKIFEKNWICIQKIKKTNIVLLSKPFDRYFILSQNIRNVLNFHRKHLKSILFVPKHSKNISFQLKTFEKYVVLAQNIRKTIKIIREIFLKYRIFSQNVQKLSYSYPKHSKSIGALSKTFTKYLILARIFEKCWISTKPIWEGLDLTQNIRKVSYLYPTY